MRLDNPIATTENCRYCLMCRHVAPVGHVTAKETLTPHGIALTVASERRGLIGWDEDTVLVVYAEPDAGNCRAHCVTDQPLPAAIAAVRADLATRGLAPAVVYELRERLVEARSVLGEHLPEPKGATGDVALFVGDEAHYLRPGTASAALSLLRAVGEEPAAVGVGRANGYLACSLGFPDMAREHVLELFEEIRATGARQLVVLSPGDLFTFRQMLPERLGVALPDGLELVDLAGLLAFHVETGRLTVSPTLERAACAYVDPTHAVRAPERFDAVRALVRAALPGGFKELFWHRERAHPVGSTALLYTRPDIADRLTRARLEDARSRGAEVLLSEDPGTLHQLSRFAREAGMQVRGLWELLAESVEVRA